MTIQNDFPRKGIGNKKASLAKASLAKASLAKASLAKASLACDKRGGTRQGAGRPSRWGSPSKVMRVPADLEEEIYAFIQERGGTHQKNDLNTDRPYKHQTVPLYASTVSAGFPSPADDHLATSLDLNDYLIDHPSATFFVRASGESMIKAGIHDGDLLVVDRSLVVAHGRIVIAAIDGELTVKRYIRRASEVYLAAENDAYKPIQLREGSSLHIWGVVTSVIHKV